MPLVPPPYPTDEAALTAATDVEVYTAGGPGGQHRNKTQTGVRLHHRPSGTRVSATERRSLAANRAVAWERLVLALTKLNHVPRKRHATKVSKAQKRHRVDAKVRSGERKKARGRVRGDE